MKRAAAIGVSAIAFAAVVLVATAATARRDGLPSYVNGYERWPKLNTRPIRSRGAHSGTKNVYASKRKRGPRYPYGTVIVKTIAAPGQRWINQFAVMRKVRGANRRANDWVMIEWSRSRRTAKFSLLARGELCTGCHMQARSNDYVFTGR